MPKSIEIIEAVPQSLHNEYTNRMKLLWATAGCMAVNTSTFFIGMGTQPQAGELLILWMGSLTFGMGSTYLNYIRKEKFIERMENAKTVFTVIESKSETESKGRNRLLRLMPPGLKAGIPMKWF